MIAALALVSCPILAGAQSSQTGPAAALPAMHDWFLSTGRWADDAQIYVREIGRGRPVVVLHGGWGSEHSGLLDAMQPLAADYRLIFYDQRGSLRSPAPPETITFDRHVEDLELLRRELELDQVTLVGHSMGAILASAYAARYPDRIARLILITPAYLKNPIPAHEQPLRHRGFLASQEHLSRAEVQLELDALGLARTDRPLTSREETAKFRIGFAARMLADVGNWPRLAGGRALSRREVNDLTVKTYPAGGWDYVAEFARRRYPVAVVAADRDFLDTGAPLLTAWASQVPRLQLMVLPSAGHLPWIDQPDGFVEAVRRHLDRTSHSEASTGR